VNRHSELGADFVQNFSFFWPTFLIHREKKKINLTGHYSTTPQICTLNHVTCFNDIHTSSTPGHTSLHSHNH